MARGARRRITPDLLQLRRMIDDYEGIQGYAAFRSELALAYVLDLDDRDHSMQASR